MDELSLVINTFNVTYCSIEVIYFYLYHSHVESFLIPKDDCANENYVVDQACSAHKKANR